MSVSEAKLELLPKVLVTNAQSPLAGQRGKVLRPGENRDYYVRADSGDVGWCMWWELHFEEKA